VRDADERHLLVGLASLVGKYLRELLMGRIVRHYRTADPALEVEHASGYHDPITTRFMVGTDALRKKRRVPDDCFVRRKLEG
jgi:ribonuclease HII